MRTITLITYHISTALVLSSVIMLPVFAQTLSNPIGSTSITAFFTSILDILLIFALPIVVLFIMYAGYLFVTAQGNEMKITQARSALWWSVIGGVIVLGAREIINLIQNTANAL